MLLIFLFSLSTSDASERCQKWFDAQKIKLNGECESKCKVIHMDDGISFDCTDECGSLCKLSYDTEVIFNISDLYPGLSDSERSLASQEPKKTLKAYWLSWNAISTCKKIYITADHNDESDACRHFVWAGLLTRDLGVVFARKILNAHEDEHGQPRNEKEMDLHNNEVGIESAEKMIKNGRYDEMDMLKLFKQKLSERKFKILEPKEYGGNKK